MKMTNTLLLREKGYSKEVDLGSLSKSFVHNRMIMR